MKRSVLVLYFLSFLLLLTDCKTTKKKQQVGEGEEVTSVNCRPNCPIVIGDGGAKGLISGSTIPSILEAINLGVDAIKLSVFITKDCQVVVSDLPKISHRIGTKPNGTWVTKKEGARLIFYRMAYDRISKYDVGKRQNPSFSEQKTIEAQVPLLRACISRVEKIYSSSLNPNPKKIVYFLEFKSNPKTDNQLHPEPKEYVDLVLSEVLPRLDSTRVIFISQDYRILKQLNAHYKQYSSGLVIDNLQYNKHLKALAYTPKLMLPQYLLSTTKETSELHHKDIFVVARDVNKNREIRNAQVRGVDGVITAFPNRALGIYGKDKCSFNSAKMTFD